MEENNNQIDFDKYEPYIAPHYGFSLEGHWQPWYDDRRDYNTNASSYYDYLANHNKIIRVLTDFTNQHTKSIDELKEYDKTLKAEIDSETARAKQAESGISQDVTDLDTKTQSSITSLRNDTNTIQENIINIYKTYDNRLHAVENNLENITRLPATGENPQALEALKTAWNSHTYDSPKKAIDSQFDFLANSLHRTKNLFNYTLITEGYYINYASGNVNPNAEWFFSDDFTVSAGEHYYVYNKNDNLGYDLHVAFFNNNHEYISGTQYGSFNIPENCVYMKISSKINQKKSIIITKGPNSKIDYQPYYSTNEPVDSHDFSDFSQVQINQQYNTLKITNSKTANISFISTLNSQLYQPQATVFKKGDFLIGYFKLITDKDIDSLNIQLMTPDNVFHSNIYYNLKSGKEYTLYFNTAKMKDIVSQNFYMVFRGKNQLLDVTNVTISDFNFKVSDYFVNGYNFNTNIFDVSSHNDTPFYDIQNCIDFVKKMVNVDEVPVTINLSNETFEIKMADNLPYAIDKGANKISIIGAGSNLTKIIKLCTATNQGKIIDAGGDCVLKGFTIEYKKDASYNEQNDYGSNPYCIHLDKSPRNDSKQYTTKVEDVVAINEVNAPIGSGLRHNQKLVYKDVTLVNKTENGKNGALYVHAPNESRATNCSFEGYNVFAIMENSGKAVNMENVPGMLEYANIDCTFYGLGVIEEEPHNYSNFKSTHRITKKSFNNNNNNFNY